MTAEKLKAKFLKYAEKLEATDKDLAQRIRDHADDLVAWYVKNRRDMTPKEFEAIIERLKQ